VKSVWIKPLRDQFIIRNRQVFGLFRVN
jgi:hypothetical protein